eukprot:EG_transcript_52774
MHDPTCRRVSYYSDGGSSECSSAPSSGGSPMTGVDTPPRFRRPASHLAHPSPTSPMTPPPRRGSESGAARPLCLDFLNGKCGRQRAHCRYYHPQPGEVTLVVPPTASADPAAPVDPAVAG